MRFAVIIAFLALPFSGVGQVFTIDDTIVQITKTTAHISLHNYGEILNDIGVDTTLRWKVSFNSVPSAWFIHFDDQTVHHHGVEDGDSADFVLQSGLSFPQKLLIGVDIDETAGFGAIKFTIYDPNNPGVSQTMTFRILVTEATVIDEQEFASQVLITDQFIRVDEMQGYELTLRDASGKLIETAISNGSTVFSFAGLPHGMYVLSAHKEEDVVSLKLMR